MSPLKTRNGGPGPGAAVANRLNNTAESVTTPHDVCQLNGLAERLSPDALDEHRPSVVAQSACSTAAAASARLAAHDLEGMTTSQRFEHFIHRNPGFYCAVVELARQFHAATGRTCGMQRLIEVARHDHELTTVSDDGLKVNNSFAPFLARLIMLREPDLDGFFTLRRAAEADAWIAARTTRPRLVAGVPVERRVAA